MEQPDREVHLQIKDHATSITQLANQVADRGVKLRLIGLALGLLEVMELATPHDLKQTGMFSARGLPRALTQR